MSRDRYNIFRRLLRAIQNEPTERQLLMSVDEKKRPSNGHSPSESNDAHNDYVFDEDSSSDILLACLFAFYFHDQSLLIRRKMAIH